MFSSALTRKTIDTKVTVSIFVTLSRLNAYHEERHRLNFFYIPTLQGVKWAPLKPRRPLGRDGPAERSECSRCSIRTMETALKFHVAHWVSIKDNRGSSVDTRTKDETQMRLIHSVLKQ